MNILVITNDFPSLKGGVASFLHNLCVQLERNGHSVQVLTFSVTPRDWKEDKRAPYRIYRLRDPRRFSSVIMIYKSVLHCLKYRIDVVLIGHLMTTHALGVLFLNMLLFIPYVISIYGLDLMTFLSKSRLDGLISRALLRRASTLMAISQFTKDEILKTGYERPDRICVVYPGVDIQEFRPDIESERIKLRFGLSSKRVLLSIGRLVRRKNHETVLRALPGVIEMLPDTVYLIVGEGREEGHLRRIVKELGLEDHVIFTGYIDQKDLPSCYSACDLFVMPSDIVEGSFEGFGIVFLEANACGKPVIGSNISGVAEAVEHGVTGLLVDPKDYDGIKDAIIRLLTDKEYSRKLGENGRKRASQKFTWESAGKKVDALLKDAQLEKRA